MKDVRHEPLEDRLTARRLKDIAALTQKKHRERLGQLLVEGVRSVEAAVEAGAPLVEILVTEASRSDERVQALVRHAAVPVHTVAARDLDRISDVQTSQGVLAVAEARWLPEAVLAERTRLVVLDGIQDPGNVGTIIRTAAWFGAEGVVAGPGTADCYHPKVVRAAMGGLWDVDLARTDDLARTLQALQDAGWAVYGADLDGTPARQWMPRAPAALVLGSEAHGLSPAVQALLDERVSIRPGRPHARHGVESLNVAIAAGILLHSWRGDG